MGGMREQPEAAWGWGSRDPRDTVQGGFPDILAVSYIRARMTRWHDSLAVSAVGRPGYTLDRRHN